MLWSRSSSSPSRTSRLAGLRIPGPVTVTTRAGEHVDLALVLLIGRLAVDAFDLEEHVGVGGLVERLGLAAETVKKRLQRAKARLLDCINRKLAAAEA